MHEGRQNPQYIHHKNPNIAGNIREFVFGMEDGMVSTLGSITGIAAATQDPFTILLAGFVIISVESISMAVGSYISNKSEESIDQRMLAEEKEEIKNFPKEEEEELRMLYVKDGWSRKLAIQMAAEAAKNEKLFLQEMAYRELGVFPGAKNHALQRGFIMGISYIGGGLIPIIPYVLLSYSAVTITISISVTLISLFILGVFITKYSKRPRLRSGMELLLLAGAAAVVGYVVGQVVETFFL